MPALLIILVALTVFGIVADRFGVDSRDDSVDPRRSEYPVGL
jgi:hypothetical protein